ncbi:MAG TPA: TlpA disulfide reductase family protein [Rhodocyclaceae bacterium]
MKKLIALALLALVNAAAAAKTPGEVDVGGVLREAELQGLAGPSRKLSDFRGKPLIINVWASWCGPCRQEMGSLERLFWRFGGKQFQLIGISTDDHAESAAAAVRASKVSFPNFIDRQLLMENMLGADHIPLTLVVDAQGRVLGKFYGAKDWDGSEGRAAIAKLLKVRLD